MSLRHRAAIGVVIGSLLLMAWAIWADYGGGSVTVTRWPRGTTVRYSRGSRVDASMQDASSTPPETPRSGRLRELRVDGDVLLIVAAADAPLTIVTRLLRIEVSERSVLRVSAFARDPGERVDLLCGRAVARKNYPSRDAAVEDLAGAQLVMVNRDIDLVEKESLDPAQPRRWAVQLGALVSDLDCSGDGTDAARQTRSES